MSSESAMSDIVERLRTAASNNRIQAGRGTTTTGEILTALGCQTKETVAEMHDEAADEITRLRSLLKEAGGTIQRLYHYHRGCHEDEDVLEPSASDWADAWEQSRSVLSKIKGEA